MILVVGEALVDLVIEPDGRVTAKLGGAPFNTARACARLGADVGFAGVISHDRFGSLMYEQLADDGVALDHVQRTDLPTTLAAAELDDGGAAIYRFYIDGTSVPGLDPLGDVAADVVFTGGLALLLEPMAEVVESLVATRAGRSMVMVDVNCRPLVVRDRDAYVARLGRVLADADIVKVSDEDLAYLAPDDDPLAAARSMLERGPAGILLTAGGDPTRVVTVDEVVEVPVGEVDIVDTIGAGDSFGGGLLAWWAAAGLGRADAADAARLAAAVEAANAVAAVVVGRRGADPPWRHELPADWSP